MLLIGGGANMTLIYSSDCPFLSIHTLPVFCWVLKFS